jgi:hypothetical protein
MAVTPWLANYPFSDPIFQSFTVQQYLTVAGVSSVQTYTEKAPEMLSVADQKAAGVAPEDTVTIAEQKAAAKAPAKRTPKPKAADDSLLSKVASVVADVLPKTDSDDTEES